MAISLVQSKRADSGFNTTFVEATFDAGATAGNLIWCAVGIDKTSGAFTAPSGFTEVVGHDSASVSTWVGYKVSTGGETTIRLDHATITVGGSVMWIGEYSDSNPGTWTIVGSANDLTNEGTRTVTPSGTTAATSAIGRALAFFSIDSGSNASTSRSYSNSYTSLQDYTAFSGRGEVAVATLADVSQGTTATTSQTHAPTADQTSGVIVVFAKTGAAAGEAFTPRPFVGPVPRLMRTGILAPLQFTGDRTSPAGAAEISLSDTGSGVDSLTSTATVPLADTGSGSDVLTLVGTIPLSDTGAGADSLAVTATVPLTDTGSGADALGVTATVPLADTGTAADALTVSVTLVLDDTGAGVDALSVQVFGQADPYQAGPQLATMFLSPSRASMQFRGDTSSGAQPANINLTDTGTAVDSMTITVTAPLADTGSGTDALAITATIPLSDTGTAADAALVGVPITLTETATAVDALTITSVSFTMADTASALDQISIPEAPALAIESRIDTGPQMFSLATGSTWFRQTGTDPMFRIFTGTNWLRVATEDEMFRVTTSLG